ncbi:MAG: DUF87 domain-containing protein [Actinomycetia bacterium]|nr:DUF87 domain-containing protein [Actinomycetes bacterium]
MSDLFLGGPIDTETGNRIADRRTTYDSSDLTTHGVIVGMTGSGKTGLGVIFLEETLSAGVPTLILDPKGDMTNLLLTFPDLAPTDFEPWIDPASVEDDETVGEVAAETANRWAEGLAGWDLDGGDIRNLRERAGFTIYTPGSTTGTPLDIIGSLDGPPGAFDDNSEALRDEILGFTSGLLGMVGIDSDPISSRETILITNLIEHAWRTSRSLDIASLLGWIQDPPIRKLGVFDVDTFFPPKDRLGLAMKLNGLLASPGFSTWMDGPPLDIESLLWSDDGTPQAAIIYLAHLSEDERQFVVTLVLSKLISWMRSQPGSGELRALVYMDEVYGFAPPTAQPPSKKPILTLLKQARAFGVGFLLSTQNPVDLDYKAMSNAGTWCIGRLQTERDKMRILEALSSAGGETNVDELDRRISGLDKRVFLLHTTRDEPRLFTTRWAMSYLRGPLTPAQVSSLTPQRTDRFSTRAPVVDAAQTDSEVGSIMPAVADEIPVRYLDPAAVWASDVGADPTSTVYEAAAAVRLTARYDETRAGVDHTVEWEAVLFPLSSDVGEAIEVDYDERDFRSEAVDGLAFRPPSESVGAASFWAAIGRGLKDRLHREGEITVYKNGPLTLYSRVGESEDEFARRCRSAAEDAADAATAKLRDKYEKRLRRLQRDIDKYSAQAESAAADASAGDFDMMAGAVFDILSGRRRSRSVSSSVKARRTAQRRIETAEGRVEDRLSKYEALQQDFEDEVGDIVGLWDDRSKDSEPITIRLEKNDITVLETALIWIPRP